MARKEKSRPHLAQFPRHWPAPMLGYWADLGKADNSPVTGAPAPGSAAAAAEARPAAHRI